MLKRSAASRALVEEFQEALDDEALHYLQHRLGEETFKQHQLEIVDLVKHYTGGLFTRLDQVNQDATNIDGSY